MGKLTDSQIKLGFKMNENCPQNDCGIYKYFFNKYQVLQADLESMAGVVSEFAVSAVKRELSKVIRELDEMYFDNYAVQLYKKEIVHSAKLD